MHENEKMNKRQRKPAKGRHQENRKQREQRPTSKVEFFAPNQQWIGNIFLNNVLLGLLGVLGLLIGGLPVRNLIELGKEKDALALAFRNRFHDPNGIGPLERIDKDGVLAG